MTRDDVVQIIANWFAHESPARYQINQPYTLADELVGRLDMEMVDALVDNLDDWVNIKEKAPTDK